MLGDQDRSDRIDRVARQQVIRPDLGQPSFRVQAVAMQQSGRGDQQVQGRTACPQRDGGGGDAGFVGKIERQPVAAIAVAGRQPVELGMALDRAAGGDYMPVGRIGQQRLDQRQADAAGAADDQRVPVLISLVKPVSHHPRGISQ